MCEYKSPKFFIKGGGTAFSNRQKDVFDQLTETEKEANERQRENKCVIMKDEDEDDLMSLDISRPPRRQCKKFRGKESIFKVPDIPPQFKPTAMPDFKRNPHRWVRYSLGDVSQDDMSEQTNRSAALSFLRELDERKRREATEDGDDMEDDAKKPIVFRNPKRVYKPPVEKLANKDDEVKAHFVSTKLIMPEYVVGKKKRLEKRSRGKEDAASTSTNAQDVETCKPVIKLGHLTQDNDSD